MNRGPSRFVVCACLTLLLGCGARTSTLEEEFGGANAGGSAGSALAGSSGSGRTPTAGAPNGGAPTAGAPNGGAPNADAGFGGSGAVGGVAVAGAPNGGSAGSFAGQPGTIGELCTVLGSNSCAACECTSCAPSLQACFSDLGCAEIFICAQQTGCTGITCYSPSTCQSVIDQAGGLGGASLKEVFSLLTCSASAQSSCGC